MGRTLVTMRFAEDVDERDGAMLDVEDPVPSRRKFAAVAFSFEAKAATIDCCHDSNCAVIEGGNRHTDGN